MQRLIFLFFVCLLVGNTLSAQCPPSGTLIYDTDAQMMTFATDFPTCTCTSVNTAILIRNGVTDLSPLSNLEQIKGFLSILNTTNLQDLDGLENLRSVGGYLTFHLILPWTTSVHYLV